VSVNDDDNEDGGDDDADDDFDTLILSRKFTVALLALSLQPHSVFCRRCAR
jgi:hypothetical protein